MWVCNVQIYKFFISNKPHRGTHDIILSVCQIFYGILTNLDISKCWDWLGYDILFFMRMASNFNTISKVEIILVNKHITLYFLIS